MLTADTITDEQIRALRDSVVPHSEVYELCQNALYKRQPMDDLRPDARRADRGRCAEILNARALS